MKKTIVLNFLVGLGLVFLLFCVLQDNQILNEKVLNEQIVSEQLEITKAELVSDFKDYSIALNDISCANSKQISAMGKINTFTEDMYGDSIGDFSDYNLLLYTSKSEIKESILNLNDAKLKLDLIDLNDSFLEEDVELRLEQIDLMILLSEGQKKFVGYGYELMDLIDYFDDKPLLRSKYDNIFSNYSEEIEIYSDNLEKLMVVEDKIELHWNKDWYVDY